MSRTVLLSLAFVLGSWFSLRTKFQYLVLSLASRLVSLLISLGLDVQKWSLLHHWSRRKALETFFLFFFGIMATRLLPTFQSRYLYGPLVIRRSYLTFIEIIKPNGCICNPVWWILRYQYLNNRNYNAMNSTKSHFIAKYNQCK